MTGSPDINESTLIRYFSNELTEEERKEVEDWIALSDENRKAAREVYYIIAAGDAFSVMNTVDTRGALRKVRERMHIRERKTTPVALFYFQRAAAILFIPLIGALLYLLFFKMEKYGQQFVEVRTNPGMVTKITLPDSSKVWLNSDSYIRYPMSFEEGQRKVEISGEAFFDVEKDAEREFVVATSEGVDIRVLGTQFNIEAYKGMENISATLLTGKINLVYTNNENKKAGVLLNPNQKVVFNKSQATVKMYTVDVSPDIAWRDGKIVFHNTALSDALKMLEKRFNVKFRILNPGLKENYFTGTFVNQQLENILKHFELSSNIRYRYIKPKPAETTNTIIEIY
ncbi:FecR family protein [Arcticibacter tournemirensis]|uniref:DUF4974 domain-containing protein n=1 Tax=Arcticibacter tournemirensis TaxID=699437 RepID=A0A5M9HI32_9SPHI|nr:FecR domain-containing protein [Arcticibacter tournemirensis]KAA8485054.1 DUF4974 domain-containing protein [Arcticibacter tournemirensis]TQM50490.1 FecR family protein [Arcticibacter tournemirensis]